MGCLLLLVLNIGPARATARRSFMAFCHARRRVPKAFTHFFIKVSGSSSYRRMGVLLCAVTSEDHAVQALESHLHVCEGPLGSCPHWKEVPPPDCLANVLRPVATAPVVFQAGGRQTYCRGCNSTKIMVAYSHRVVSCCFSYLASCRPLSMVVARTNRGGRTLHLVTLQESRQHAEQNADL